MLNIFQAFRNWLEYYILFSLACYPFAAYLNYFLPFIDSDGSKFPWLCFFHISSKGPFSFWVGSDLQLSVLSPSVCSQTCKRHYWNPYQTASLSDRGLPKSSTKLDFLTDPLPLSLLKKKKKNSRNLPLLIRLIKKENVFSCCPVSLHEAVFSFLTLYIQALRDRDCHFNLYFSMLTTSTHDEGSRHYSIYKQQ